MHRLPLVLMLLTTAVACDRMGRVRECRRVAQLTNARFDEVSALASKGSPAGFASAAVVYKSLGKAVREHPYPGEAGRALSEEYAGMMEQIAPAASAYADALASHDQHRIDEARRTLTRLKRTEQSLAGRVDAFCASPH